MPDIRKPPDSPRAPRRDLTLVAYDLPDNRRRRRIARLADDVGRRVQKSVFEAWLTPAELERFVARMAREIDPAVDRIALVRCCPACQAQARTLGLPQRPRRFPISGSSDRVTDPIVATFDPPRDEAVIRAGERAKRFAGEPSARRRHDDDNCAETCYLSRAG